MKDTGAMDQGGEQMRLAVAVFDLLTNLRGAVCALLSEGASLRQLGLVARASLMERVIRLGQMNESEWAELSALARNLKEWHGLGNGNPIVATLRPHVAALHQVLNKKEFAAKEAQALGNAASHFIHHVNDGAAALVVQSDTPEQQAISTRILLERSNFNVRTYEFMTRIPGDTWRGNEAGQ